MPMEVHTARIDIHRLHEAPEGHHLTDATVHLKVQSELGVVEVAVLVESSHGTDHAIDDARRKLQAWAKNLASSAMLRPAERYRE